MGKQKRQRQKLHIASSKSESTPNIGFNDFTPPALTITPDDNIFKNINFDKTSFKKALWSDTGSIKSFKSLKSEKSSDKALSKKDKIKLRREYLLKKIDTVVQAKKAAKQRNKKKKGTTLNNTNSLLEALPSLESLLKSREKVPTNVKPVPKRKCIQKAYKRQKGMVQSVQLYKKIVANKKFKENPLLAISEHVRAVVEEEKKAKK